MFTKRKKQIPDYEISESIRIIENPELEIIKRAQSSLIEIAKDDLSESDLQILKERRIL